MLILLSPTKQMDFTRIDKYKNLYESPTFSQEARSLNRELRNLERESLMKLMKISDKLADSTISDIGNFVSLQKAKQSALFAYSGTVFQWIKSEDFCDDHLEFASEHLRILSGLYGVLKPNECISQYRLEMKTPLSIGEDKNLYHFWNQKITEYLIEEDRPIINIASAEYSKAIDKKRLKHPFISVQFKEREGRRVRTVGMYSKMARGKMAGRIIREKVVNPEILKEWNLDGYQYDEELSSDTDWVFANTRS